MQNKPTKLEKDFDELTKLYAKMEALQAATRTSMELIVIIPVSVVQEVDIKKLVGGIEEQRIILESISRDVERFTQRVKRGG